MMASHLALERRIDLVIRLGDLGCQFHDFEVWRATTRVENMDRGFVEGAVWKWLDLGWWRSK